MLDSEAKYEAQHKTKCPIGDFTLSIEMEKVITCMMEMLLCTVVTISCVGVENYEYFDINPQQKQHTHNEAE